jgi:hypothetical protein
VQVDSLTVQLEGERVSIHAGCHFRVHEAPGARWGGVIHCDGIRIGRDCQVEVLLQDALNAAGVRKFPAGAAGLAHEGLLTQQIWWTEDYAWHDIKCLKQRVYALHVKFWEAYSTTWSRTLPVLVYNDVAFNFQDRTFAAL